jgi:hypothetical protein
MTKSNSNKPAAAEQSHETYQPLDDGKEPAIGETNGDHKKPVFSKRETSNIEVAVWPNDNEHGPDFSIRIARSYCDKKGEWKTTNLYSPGQIYILRNLLDEFLKWHEAQKI